MPQPTAMPPDVPSSAGGERRASARIPCRLETCLRFPKPTGEVYVTTVRELSAGGLSLLLPRWFGPGTLLDLEMQVAGEREPLLLSACVLHASLRPDGNWFVGCALLAPLSPDELKSLL